MLKKTEYDPVRGLGKRITFHGVLIVVMIGIVVGGATLTLSSLGRHKEAQASDLGKIQTMLNQHAEMWKDQKRVNADQTMVLNKLDKYLSIELEKMKSDIKYHKHEP